MWNSFVVAGLSTILCVFVGALAAYALTRLRSAAPRHHVDSARRSDVSADLADGALLKLMRERLNTYPR